MKMQRVWAMPSADTFDVLPIGNFVRRYLAKSTVSIDPFARNKRWATYTNDLNPDTAAEWHMEAAEFLRMLVEKGVKADLVIFDPPYSLEQCKRSYETVGRVVTMRDTQIWGRWTEAKNHIAKLLTPDGYVLSFGWHSNGMGKKRGFDLEELLLVPHGGAHNDTICIAERKVQSRLGECLGLDFEGFDLRDDTTQLERWWRKRCSKNGEEDVPAPRPLSDSTTGPA